MQSILTLRWSGAIIDTGSVATANTGVNSEERHRRTKERNKIASNIVSIVETASYGMKSSANNDRDDGTRDWSIRLGRDWATLRFYLLANEGWCASWLIRVSKFSQCDYFLPEKRIEKGYR